MNAVVPMLEESLVWDESGHLAACAISAIADGELALVSDGAVQHAETCAHCAARVGEAVMFALEIADAAEASLVSLAIEPVHGTAIQVAARGVPPLPAPLPVPAVIGALLLALVSGAPWLCSFHTTSLPKLLAVIGQAIVRAMETARTPGLAEAAWLAAAILVVGGGVVAWISARSTVPITKKVSS